jgi:hypothetical protein
MPTSSQQQPATAIPISAKVVEQTAQRMVLTTDTPAGVPGNALYHLLAIIPPQRSPLELIIRWPSTSAQPFPGFLYPHNENFSTVLERTCFVSTDLQDWQRVEKVSLRDHAVGFQLDPASSPRWIASGVPYFGFQLDNLLDAARASGVADVQCIGYSRNGRPIHGIFIAQRRTAGSAGLFSLQAYQHFSEWAGLHALDALLRMLISDPGPAAAFAWAIVPCINVDALYGGWREDPMFFGESLEQGANLNRDWLTFVRPETKAARDFHAACAQHAPMLHGLDIHMGWSSPRHSGGGLTVFQEGELPADAAADEQAFTNDFFHHVPIEAFPWQVSAIDRPNFASWLWRSFGAIGQTMEVSRFMGYCGRPGHFKPCPVSLQYYRDLGPLVANALVQHYTIKQS